MTLDQEALKKELVETFHLETLPTEKQEALLSQIGEALLKRIFLETMDKLGDAGVKEYEGLLDKSASQEEVEAFFEQKIPGYGAFVKEVVEKFKEEMKEGLV